MSIDQVAGELDWYRTAFLHTPLGMARVTTDRQVLSVNPALCRILGRTAPEILDLGISALTHPEDAHLHTGEHERLLAGEIDGYTVQKRYLHADGSIVWANLHVALVVDASGLPHSLVSQIEDVTARVEAELELAWIASHDALSGLLDRGGFFREVERWGDGSDLVGVVFIDLDRFKTINDTYGHAAGDAVIAAVGHQIRSCLPDSGIAGRLGGDEFVLLMRSADVAAVVDDMSRGVEVPGLRSDGVTVVSSSIGTALGRLDAIDDLVRRADESMYRAKR